MRPTNEETKEKPKTTNTTSRVRRVSVSNVNDNSDDEPWFCPSISQLPAMAAVISHPLRLWDPPLSPAMISMIAAPVLMYDGEPNRGTVQGFSGKQLGSRPARDNDDHLRRSHNAGDVTDTNAGWPPGLFVDHSHSQRNNISRREASGSPPLPNDHDTPPCGRLRRAQGRMTLGLLGQLGNFGSSVSVGDIHWVKGGASGCGVAPQAVSWTCPNLRSPHPQLHTCGSHPPFFPWLTRGSGDWAPSVGQGQAGDRIKERELGLRALQR